MNYKKLLLQIFQHVDVVFYPDLKNLLVGLGVDCGMPYFDVLCELDQEKYINLSRSFITRGSGFPLEILDNIDRQDFRNNTPHLEELVGAMIKDLGLR